jgi:hypothetical protein
MKSLNAQKISLYDMSWQALRLELKGNWHSNYDDNISKLKEYIEPANSMKLYRVVNLLSAVRMGFHGSKLVGSKADKAIVAFHLECSQLYARSNKSFTLTMSDIAEQVKRANIDVLIRISADLQHRLDLHSTSKHREELREVLRIIKMAL